MFLSVPADGDFSCQQYPDSFRLHRKAQFSIWSDDTLESYLYDLQRAEKEEKNLMTIKYARMDDLIPRENSNPLIDRIAEIQYRWQKELFHTYRSTEFTQIFQRNIWYLLPVSMTHDS